MFNPKRATFNEKGRGDCKLSTTECDCIYFTEEMRPARIQKETPKSESSYSQVEIQPNNHQSEINNWDVNLQSNSEKNYSQSEVHPWEMHPQNFYSQREIDSSNVQFEECAQPFYSSQDFNYKTTTYNSVEPLDLQTPKIGDTDPLLAQNVYFLNKSNSKWVSVGLSLELHFDPIIRIMGVKKQCISFSEDEWKQFLNHKYLLMRSFTDKRGDCVVTKIRNIKISFESVDSLRRIIKLEREKECLYLSYEGLLEVWRLSGVISYRLELLKQLNYKRCYDEMVECLSSMEGDVRINMESMMNGVVSDINSITRELMVFGLSKVFFDVDLLSTIKI